MDIPDIELVVVYGLPDSVSQLYQVSDRLMCISVYIIVLFGSCVVELDVEAANQGLICC